MSHGVEVRILQDIVTRDYRAQASWDNGGQEYGAVGKPCPTVGEAIYNLGDVICRFQVTNPEWFPFQSVMTAHP